MCTVVDYNVDVCVCVNHTTDQVSRSKPALVMSIKIFYNISAVHHAVYACLLFQPSAMIVNVHAFSQSMREELLQRRREREKACCASETAAEKDKRLRRDQEWRAAETKEQRGARLQRKHSRQSENIPTKTDEQHVVSLIGMRERLERVSRQKASQTRQDESKSK